MKEDSWDPYTLGYLDDPQVLLPHLLHLSHLLLHHLHHPLLQHQQYVLHLHHLLLLPHLLDLLLHLLHLTDPQLTVLLDDLDQAGVVGSEPSLAPDSLTPDTWLAGHLTPG